MFASRFNFIAVDYLVYTHEVLGNIWESYPVATWLALLLIPALATTFLLARPIVASFDAPVPFSRPHRRGRALRRSAHRRRSSS
jgi:hypothetical protein